jgi:hypothetical protein
MFVFKRNARRAGLAIVWALGALWLSGCGAEPASDLGGMDRSDATAAEAGASSDAAPPADSSLVVDEQTLTIVQPDPSSDAATCTPATGCPSGFACGRFTDLCSGQTFACGSPCTSTEVCASDPNDSSAQTCQPKACAGRCGVVGLDGCGVPIACGGCPTGQDCVDNACVAPTPPSAPSDTDACAALSCTLDTMTHLCGTITDGCGHTMNCSCAAGQVCSGGVCNAPLPECDATDAGVACGTVANACGSGSVSCGTCPTGGQCVKGRCTGCAPLVCGIESCGTLKNACGETIQCGACEGGAACVSNTCQTCTPLHCGIESCGTLKNACGASLDCGGCETGACYDGNCCTAKTCAEVDAGPGDCTPVDLGCGESQSCSPCEKGEVCTNHKCVTCAPKTCSDFDNAGCGHADGCGKTLDCCPSGTTCQGSVCCGPGEVAYQGSCCLPSCDANLPPGPQNSCGQVIVCAPGHMGGPR